MFALRIGSIKQYSLPTLKVHRVAAHMVCARVAPPPPPTTWKSLRSLTTKSTTDTAEATAQPQPFMDVNGRLIYIGHLARTARFLKLFSVSSLGITLLGVPFIFLMKSGMSVEFRTALASAALVTSLSSTGIIHYALAPYVTQITLPHASTEALPDTIEPITEDTELSIDTLTFFGQPRRTNIRAGDLMPSTRFFSSWKSPIGQEFHVQSDTVQTEEMLQLVQMMQSKQTQ